MRKIALVIFIVCSPLTIEAQCSFCSGIIANPRTADWTQVGAGTIPANRTQCGSTIAAYGASSARQSSSTISSQFNGCVAGTYVLLGNGTFFLSDQLVLTNSNVTLRGAGPNNTILDFGTVNTPCGEARPTAICVAGGDDRDGGGSQGPLNIGNVTGLSQTATTINLGTQTTGTQKPRVGDILVINQNVDGTSTAGDNWPLDFHCIRGNAGATNACTQGGSTSNDLLQSLSPGGPLQVVKITSIGAGTCTDASPCVTGISPPIHWPDFGQETTRAWWSTTASLTGVGIEALRINGNTPAIGFRWTSSSWVKNVQEDQNGYPGGAPHYNFINHSTLLTFRDSYFFGQGNWSDEYTFDCYEGASVLAENNIIEYLRLGFAAQGCSGFVFSYNYFLDNAGSHNPGNEEGCVNNHGGGAGYALLEGNDCVNPILDNYYGACHFCTLFRNRFWGETSLDDFGNTHILMALEINALGRFDNMLANVLGTSGFHINYQTVGGDGQTANYGDKAIYSLGKGCGDVACAISPPDDLHAAASDMRWGNWDVVTNAVRWCASNDPNFSMAPCSSTSEIPTGLTNYSNPNPSSHTLPASFLYSSRPVWWCVVGQTCPTWPAIGPDVSSGNLANSGGLANKIPARVCFESVMGGSFSDTTPKTFNADSCYPTSAPANGPSGVPRGVLLAAGRDTER